MSEVQFAVAADRLGNIVHAKTCMRGIDVVCVECASEMVLRRGDILQPHFAHKPGCECVGTPESAAHKAGKRLLAKTLGGWLRGAEGPSLHRACKHCGMPRRKPMALVLPEGAVVEEEYRASGASRRVDVAITSPANDVAYFEVYVDHPVDFEKARALTGTGVPWVEISAYDLVEHDGRLIVPISGSDVFRWDNCPTCSEKQFARSRQVGACHWSCKRCGAAFDVARIACASCGSFSPDSVQAKRMEAFRLAGVA